MKEVNEFSNSFKEKCQIAYYDIWRFFHPGWEWDKIVGFGFVIIMFVVLPIGGVIAMSHQDSTPTPDPVYIHGTKLLTGNEYQELTKNASISVSEHQNCDRDGACSDDNSSSEIDLKLVNPSTRPLTDVNITLTSFDPDTKSNVTVQTSLEAVPAVQPGKSATLTCDEVPINSENTTVRNWKIGNVYTEQ